MIDRRVLAVGGVTVAVALAALALAAAGPPFLRTGGRADGGDRVAHSPTRRDGLGGVQWSTALTGWPFALAADHELAVVIEGRGGVEALGVVDGRRRWKASVAGAGLEPPALDGRTVLVPTSQRVVALDRATGQLQWERTVTGRPAAVALATLSDGSVHAIVTSDDGTVLSLDVASGVARWQVAFRGPVLAAPSIDVATGSVAVEWHGPEPSLRVLELGTGGTRWSARIPGGSTAPVTTAGLVITGEGDARGHARVVAREATTGAERWTLPVPASFEPSVTPDADRDAVVVADHFGAVTLARVHDGAGRWQARLDEPVLRTAIRLTGDRVVLTTHAGAVAVLDRRTGAVLRRAAVGGFPAGVAVTDQRLLVAVRVTEPGRVESRPLA